MTKSLLIIMFVIGLIMFVTGCEDTSYDLVQRERGMSGTYALNLPHGVLLQEKNGFRGYGAFVPCMHYINGELEMIEDCPLTCNEEN